MTVHIIGTGISGLSAAFTLTQAKIPVALYDAAGHAGGRCHSFFDKNLNAVIDNGTHLMLGANTALLDMLKQCPNDTPLKNCGHHILFLKKDGSAFQIDTSKPFKALFKLPVLYPLLCESVMNTPFKKADTGLFLKTAFKCFGKENGLVYLADPSLTDSVVKPVVHFLKNKNVPFYFGKRLKRVKEQTLSFFDGDEFSLSKEDKVILAVDAQNLSRLIVGAEEMPFQTIINFHFKADLRLPQNACFAGLIGFTGHWIFIKNGILSVTISAANTLLEKLSADAVASLVWQEISSLFKISSVLPVYRVIVEKRATVSQTKAVNQSRLNSDIGSKTVFLAGDFTRTSLPCTIEGGVRSGITAAQNILNDINQR